MRSAQQWLDKTNEVISEVNEEGYTSLEELSLCYEYDENGVMLIRNAFIPVGEEGEEDWDEFRIVNTFMTKKMLESQVHYLQYRLQQEKE